MPGFTKVIKKLKYKNINKLYMVQITSENFWQEKQWAFCELQMQTAKSPNESIRNGYEIIPSRNGGSRPSSKGGQRQNRVRPSREGHRFWTDIK
jgi:hypothetical protein